MNKEQAESWAIEVSERGSFPIRTEYLELFDVGKIAKKLWHDPVFTLGIEYGIKIAVSRIFGDLEE